MCLARVFECCADRANAPVHHVRWRDDVKASLGLSECHADQGLDGDIVEHISGVIDDAVLAVRGVGIKRDIANQAQLRMARLECACSPLEQAVRIPRLSRIERLQADIDRRKQGQCREAECNALVGKREQMIDRHALDPGH